MRKATTRPCITGGEVYVVGMEASLTKQGGMLVMTELVEGWLVAVNLVAFAVYGIDKYKSMYGRAYAFVFCSRFWKILRFEVFYGKNEKI